MDHAPIRSGYNTPLAYAPDFATDFDLRIDPGYHPPEIVPGWITRAEGELLWRFAAGRVVLEIGAGCGRQTVCLAQTARQVIAVDASDPKEAQEWVCRYGVANRVKFCSLEEVPSNERFGLVVVSARDAAGIRRDLERCLPLIEADGLVAVHHYPDPAWPDVRVVLDELAKKHRWKRVKQVDYLGIFQN